MLKNQLKIAYRNLLNARLFTFLNILGLTGGMVTAVFILLWVQNELSFDAFHKRSDRLYRIITHLQISKEETWHWSSTPSPLADQLKTVPEIEKFARANATGSFTISMGARKIAAEKNVYVDPAWFEMFDYQVVSGALADFTKGIRTVALSEAAAENLFGKKDVAGQTMRIDSLDYTVAAVYKNNPANSSFQYDYMLPIAAFLADPAVRKNEGTWNNFNGQTFIQVKKGADIGKLNKRLTSIISNFKKDDHGKPSTDMQLEAEKLVDMHFNKEIQANNPDVGDRQTIYIFLGLALVILLVACINYVNLTTARASVRSKEVGVKKLLGAKSGHLFGQFMMESVLTCLCALVLALAALYLLLPKFNLLTGKTFELSLLNISLWYVLLGTMLFASVLTGVYPSILLSSFKPFQVVRGANVMGTTSGGFRKGLVVVQFGVTVVFLMSALVVYRQMEYIGKKKLGYSRDNIFSARIPYSVAKRVSPETFQSMLLHESSIADVTLANQNIVDILSSTSGSYDWDGRPKDFNPTVSQIGTEHSFQRVFNLKMVHGRWFEPNREADLNNVVLNETAVRKLGLRKPVVGRRFDFHGRKGTIIGVVKDFHFKSLRQAIEPLVLFNGENNLGLYIKIVPGQERQAIAATEKIWSQMIPDHPFQYKFLDENYDRLYRSEQRTATLFNTFTLTAVLISCMGLFGLATFTAERRFKEIGIRKVLGASVTSIVALLSRDFVILVLAAIALGAPIGYYFMDKWLQGFAYRIQIEWSIWAVSGVAAVVIALLTISYQSVKAALMNPVKTLRSE